MTRGICRMPRAARFVWLVPSSVPERRGCVKDLGVGLLGWRGLAGSGCSVYTYPRDCTNPSTNQAAMRVADQSIVLSAETITAALTTHRLAHPVVFFAQVGSTNDVVHEYAAAGAAEGLLVVADEQTAGRGRLNRSWWAPPRSSLLMSLLLRPPMPPNRAGRLAMCMGLGAIEGIAEITDLRPALKWPNDLVLNGRKLGGILAELRTSGDHLDYAVLGLGLNVNMELDEERPLVSWTSERTEGESNPSHPAALDRSSVNSSAGAPPEVVTTAISLSMALGRPVERLALLVAVLAHCEAWYERLLAEEIQLAADERLHKAWMARLDTLKRAVLITTPGEALRGVAVGVTPEGALLVRGNDGRIHTVWSGDVTAVRPDPVN
jgi:BirA family biotin operon repressor/biotin-[acetyl-CoA-carboxylase] ligase